MRKQRALFLCLLLGVVCLMGSPAAEAAEPQRLSVTYVASPLNVPSIVEREEKLFEKAFPGRKILWPELNAGPKQTAAMASGEVDIAHCLGATSAILAASEGLDLRIVGVYSRAPVAFVLMTKNPEIKRVRDLKGKKIAGPKGTILHQLLAAATAEAGLKAHDYEFINMGIPAAAAALAGGSVHAALLAGADAYNATAAGAVVLRNGIGLVDGITVIATTKRYLEKNGELVSRFVKTHGELAASLMEEVDDDADDGSRRAIVELVAKEMKLPLTAVEEMYDWYDFQTSITDRDREELKRTQEFMLENGLQRRRIDIDAILSPR